MEGNTTKPSGVIVDHFKRQPTTLKNVFGGCHYTAQLTYQYIDSTTDLFLRGDSIAKKFIFIQNISNVRTHTWMLA